MRWDKERGLMDRLADFFFPVGWHKVFAIFPVDTIEGKTVWFEWVEKRQCGTTLDYVACYEYRLINESK